MTKANFLHCMKNSGPHPGKLILRNKKVFETIRVQKNLEEQIEKIFYQIIFQAENLSSDGLDGKKLCLEAGGLIIHLSEPDLKFARKKALQAFQRYDEWYVLFLMQQPNGSEIVQRYLAPRGGLRPYFAD